MEASAYNLDPRAEAAKPFDAYGNENAALAGGIINPVNPSVQQSAPPVQGVKTWTDMKSFVNGLTDEQLSMKLVWWGEERGGRVACMDVLEDDYVKVDEYCEAIGNIELQEGESIEDYPVVYVKGQPIITVD